jgi:hypothetical protein
MVALTADRKTAERKGLRYNFPVDGGSVIFLGAMVALNAAGYLVPASADSSLRVVGVAMEHKDATGLADGILRCEVSPGIFRFANTSAGDAITLVNGIGRPAYVVFDNQVALTDNGGARPIAGLIVDVDEDGVWVDFGPTELAAAAGGGARVIGLDIPTNVSATAYVARYVHSGPPMSIRSIRSVISAALATGDMTITAAINGVAVTGGVITVTQVGSAAGDIDIATPTAANVITEGQQLTLTVGGTNTGAGHTDVAVELAP